MTQRKSSGVVGICNLTVINPVPVQCITLSDNCLVLNKGTTHRLTATVCPADATNKLVSWCSSNENVASVNHNGVVTAKAAGTATIQCSAIDGSNVYTCCNVEVVILIDSVTFEPTHKMLWLNSNERSDTYKLEPIISPPDATDKRLTFCSDNPCISKVDSQSGIVTALAPGEAAITAITHDGSGVRGNFTAYSEDARAQGLIVCPSEAKIGANDPAFDITILSADIIPSYADKDEITWSSGDTSIATIEQYTQGLHDSQVIVRGHSSGTAVITAKAGRFTASCTITVDARERAEFKKEPHVEYLDINSRPGLNKTVYTVTFHNSNGSKRVWHSLGAHIQHGFGPLDTELEADYNFRFNANYAEFVAPLIGDGDSETKAQEREKVISQLAYLYRFDPLGVEELVATYAVYMCDNTKQNGSLLFKDALFYKIFGKEPLYYSNVKDEFQQCYKQTNGSYKSPISTILHPRNEVYSQAELLFGQHNVLNWTVFAVKTAKALVDFAINILISKLGLADEVKDAWDNFSFACNICNAIFISGSFDDFSSTAVSAVSQEYLESFFKNGSEALERFTRVSAIGALLLDCLDAFEALIEQPELTKIVELDRAIYAGEKDLEYRTYIHTNRNRYFLDDISQ